jgi:hypothetical protein
MYSMDEIKAYTRAVESGNVRRLLKIDVTHIVSALTDAFEELNTALKALVRSSNHDGKWN